MLACPVCSAKTDLQEIEHLEGYILYLCRACDVVFSDPMKAAGQEWYEKHYEESLALPRLSELSWSEKQFFKNVSRSKGQLLELGCGPGHFLAKAQEAGFESKGVDFSRRAVEETTEEFGLRCAEAVSFEDFFKREESASYDACVFFEVLEHQENPNRFLQGVLRLLRPGGMIALSVPNRVRKPNVRLACDYPPYHLTRWSPKSLHFVLSTNGFQVLKLMDSGLRIMDLIHPYLSLAVVPKLLTQARNFPVGSRSRRSLVKISSYLGSLKYGFLNLVTAPVNLLGDLLGAKGETLFALAQLPICRDLTKSHGKPNP